MLNNTSDLNSLQQALDEAIKSSQPDAIIEASKDLVKYHQSKGETATSITYIKSMIAYLRNPDKWEDLAHNLSYLGKCHMVLDMFQEAEEAYNQALQIYEEKNLVLGVADVETDLGILFRHTGDFEVSLIHLNKAIDIYRGNIAIMEENTDPRPWDSYVNAIECCGIIHGQMQQYQQSISMFESAVELKKKHCSNSSLVSALINLGATYSNLDIDKAADYYLKAMALLDDKSPTYYKVVLLNNLGGCLEDKGNLEDALKYYLEALKYIEGIGAYHYQAPVYKHIGTIYYKQGRFEEALSMIDKGMSIAEKIDAKAEVKDFYLALSDIYSAKNEFQEALNYRIKYDAIKDEIFQQDIGKQMSSLQKKFQNTSQNVTSLRQEKSLITSELKKVMNTGFVGVSNGIREVQKLALEASFYKDAKVLITGESGVGKEIVARYIHYSDTMNTGRFVDVNCCSIPDTMVESEFFGYVKGAFTGALHTKEGYFVEANQGTLFLDEIGDMPSILQAKLLRVLETKQVKRLGTNKNTEVGFRLISATNKDLSCLIRDNRFRADLLYRINTIHINIPPLRERKEDIEPILEYYLCEYARKMNKTIPTYGADVINCLNDYSFPGNVRELRNMIEKAMIFIKGDRLVKSDFASQMVRDLELSTSPKMEYNLNRKETEQRLILDMLTECNGNQTLAANKLGMPYSTFRRKYLQIRKKDNL